MPYITREDLELKFGKRNIAKWADLDGEDEEANINARIDSICDIASAQADALVRGGIYKVPLTSAPLEWKDMVTAYAGALLYEGRGVIDAEDEKNPLSDLKSEAIAWFQSVKAGRVRLSLDPDYVSSPVAVND